MFVIPKPRHFIFVTSLIYMALQRIRNESSWIWFKLNFITLVLSTGYSGIICLLQVIYSWSGINADDPICKSSVISTLVSSANNRDLEQVFIPRVRSLMCITNNKGPKIDPWGNTFYCSPAWLRYMLLTLRYYFNHMLPVYETVFEPLSSTFYRTWKLLSY